MSKKKLVEADTVEVTHGCSAIMSSKIMEKKEDPGAFTIPCTIGTHKFKKTLFDLGASINIIPFAIYQRLGLSIPTPKSMKILMVDRSIKKSIGVLFNVLVKVDKFIIVADFVMLDCDMDQEVPIILSRPFFATGRGIVDLELGEMRFRVHNGEVSFQVGKIKKQPMKLKVASTIGVEVEKVKNGIALWKITTKFAFERGICLDKVMEKLPAFHDRLVATGW
ncbi:uncharacterized protein LOC124888862 [Capsicum annuum]|uniref:uncharacterized protein LOC124888862 n=1 Tax=Capsicum annuum TaxID=4072 RepID=UPI001FB05D6A|nr:uncharacterized protein LOC124888862 [Capsicum annuum]